MSEWLPGWSRSGRLETPDALANQDLWQQLAALAAKHRISWEWVRGHAGHPFNERCDKLAKRAVEAGIKAVVDLADETVPLPMAAAYHAPVALRVDSEFDADADGQLLLC
jgi:ribonuclease HI